MACIMTVISVQESFENEFTSGDGKPGDGLVGR